MISATLRRDDEDAVASVAGIVDLNARRYLVGINEEPCASLQTTGIELLRADQIVMEPVDWLWNGYLAAGKLHILAGAPGTGKTTIAMSMAATITRGAAWPEGDAAPKGDVLIWSGEDSAADTLVPRLAAAGADLSRVHFIGDVRDGKRRRSFDPARDVERLCAQASALTQLRLVILDPIVSAVSGDSHKNAEVRRALQPLVEFAEKTKSALVGITHFSKGTAGRDPVERVSGSHAFGALARVVLVTAKVPEEQGGGGLMIRAKANLGLSGGGLRYRIDEMSVADGISTSKAAWGQKITGDAASLLIATEQRVDPEEHSRVREAEAFLKDLLSNGPVDAKDGLRLARENGISKRTLDRAKSSLGVASNKRGFRDGFDWELPSSSCNVQGRQPEDVATFDDLGNLGSGGDVGGAAPSFENKLD